MACFRHWHGYRYGKSDIYFVCRLRALTEQIKMSEQEIEECLWMPVHDFMTDDDISPFNKGIVRSALESDGIVPADMPGMPHDPDAGVLPARLPERIGCVDISRNCRSGFPRKRE